MLDAPFAFAFAAGAVAAFNPCGFALLPAYLSYFLGVDDGPAPVAQRVWGATVVAGAVSLGFAVVFGIAGLLISQAGVAVATVTPWISIVVGLALVPLGVAVARGWQPPVRLPKPGGRRDGRGLLAMASFGASYATVSLSCTIPAFLVAVVSTFEQEDVASGMTVFGAYAAGMGAVLAAVTLAVALTREALVRSLRRVLPQVQLLSGGLLVLAGLYVAYYGFYEVRLEDGVETPSGPIDAVGRWSGWFTERVDALGTWPIALTGVLVATGAALAVVVSRRNAGGRSPR